MPRRSRVYAYTSMALAAEVDYVHRSVGFLLSPEKRVERRWNHFFTLQKPVEELAKKYRIFWNLGRTVSVPGAWDQSRHGWVLERTSPRDMIIVWPLDKVKADPRPINIIFLGRIPPGGPVPFHAPDRLSIFQETHDLRAFAQPCCSRFAFP